MAKISVLTGLAAAGMISAAGAAPVMAADASDAAELVQEYQTETSIEEEVIIETLQEEQTQVYTEETDESFAGSEESADSEFALETQTVSESWIEPDAVSSGYEAYEADGESENDSFSGLEEDAETNESENTVQDSQTDEKADAAVDAAETLEAQESIETDVAAVQTNAVSVSLLEASGLNQETSARTEEEIQEYYKQYLEKYHYELSDDPFFFTTFYDENGGLSEQGYEEVLALINYYRWAVGLNPVEMSEEFSAYAQAAVDYLSENGLNAQHWLNTDDKGKEEYEDAEKGLKNSSIDVSGISDMPVSEFIKKFFADSSSASLRDIVDRRKLLDPELGYIGIGFTNSDGPAYFSIYFKDGQNPDYSAQPVSFPSSGAFAIENFYTADYEAGYFNLYPWSLQLGEEDGGIYYRIKDSSPENITITAVRDDGTVFTLSGENYLEYWSGSIGAYGLWFMYSGENYPGGPAIIFSPSFIIGDDLNNLNGHSFEISISGLTDQTGADAVYTFSPSFFSLSSGEKLDDETKGDVFNVIASISELNTDPTYKDYNSYQSVMDKYNALPEEAKSYVTNYDVLESGYKTALEDFQNYTAAREVVAMIESLSRSITLEDEDAVNQAQKSYDALTDAQKSYVWNTSRLEKAQAKLQQLRDEQDQQEAEEKEAVKTCSDLISALPDSVELSDEAAVAAARTAYDALTDSQKQMIDADLVLKLEEAENQTAKLKEEETLREENRNAALQAAALIQAIPDTLTLDDEDAVIQARQAYDALTDVQRSFVDQQTAAKLTLAEQNLFILKENEADRKAAQNAQEQIAAALTDEEILEAKASYDCLTDQQKAFVSESVLEELNQKLDDYYQRENQKRTDEEAVKAYEEMVAALPESITLNDKNAVEELRRAYNALTESQKAAADASVLEKAEKAIEELERIQEENIRKASEIEEKILQFAQSGFTLDDLDAFKDLQNSWDALTDDQKVLVSQSTADLLEEIEKGFANLQKESILKEAASVFDQAVASLLPQELTLEDEQTVLQIRSMYNALDPEAQAYVTSFDQLKLAEEQMKNLKEEQRRIQAENVQELIQALPDEIQLSDKEAVEEARKVYDQLDSGQKEMVDNALLIQAEKKLEAKQIEDLIGSLEEEYTPEQSDTLKEIGERIDAFENDGMISDESLSRYEEALVQKAAYDQKKAEEAQEVIDLVQNEPTVGTVASAAAAYKNLTEEQRDLLPVVSKERLNQYVSLDKIDSPETGLDDIDENLFCVLFGTAAVSFSLLGLMCTKKKKESQF